MGGNQGGGFPVVLRGAASAAAAFLLPIECPSCNRLLDADERGIVCGRCWSRLATLSHPQCGRCGHPGAAAPCAWCRLVPSYVRCVRSVCWTHRGTGSAIVHALKYGGWHAVAADMAERMGRLSWLPDVIEERTAIVPVPLSARRERELGYNQSHRLAASLAAWWGVPVWSDVLERARNTETQTRLTPAERLANVSGAFRVRGEQLRVHRSAHLVIADDVVTTGATLNACAAALIAGGARIVSYVTFGRAPAQGDR